MVKRWRVEDHVEEVEYNLPVSKSKRKATFRPNGNDFRLLLTEVFISKLTSIIKVNLNQGPESNDASWKNIEAECKKVLPNAFEALDSQHDSYWKGNTAKRLKINTLLLYKSYLHGNFDSLIDAVNETLNEETELEEGKISTQSVE